MFNIFFILIVNIFNNFFIWLKHSLYIIVNIYILIKIIIYITHLLYDYYTCIIYRFNILNNEYISFIVKDSPYDKTIVDGRFNPIKQNLYNVANVLYKKR